MQLVGQQLGNYRIIEEIGRGGMAVVYKGYQASLNRYVAVKVLSGPMAHDPVFRQRFVREARAVANINHPHILPIYDFGEDPEREIVYLVTRLVDGGSLKERMGQPWPVEPAVQLVCAIADALDTAHRHGIIHRDVKPSNILLDQNGHPYLCDFGIAKVLTGTQYTETGTTIGTPEYMSPEQAQGLELDGRADEYSLGVVLYQMLTGTVPFQGDTPLAVIHQHVYDPPPPPRTINRHIPRKLERVIMRALAKDPARRFPSCGEMAQALRKTLPRPSIISRLQRQKEKPIPSIPPALASAPTVVRPSTPRPRRRPTPTQRPTFLARLGQGLLRLSLALLKILLSISLVLAVIFIILTLLAAYGLSVVAERGLAAYPWDYDRLVSYGENVILEESMQEGLVLAVEPFALDLLTDVRVDFRPPDEIEFTGRVSGRPLTIQCTLSKKEDLPPLFRIDHINNVRPYIIGGIISAGVRRGLDKALDNSPVPIATIHVEEEAIVIQARK